MAEIKFKGFSKELNKWVFGNLIKTESGQNYIFDYHFIPAISVPSEKFIEVVTESIGQMWEPSNGLIVYSGDLLLAVCSPSGSKVKKERICKIGYGGRGMTISVYHKKEWWAYSSMDFTTAKPIGNIFTNSELLTK